MRYTITGRNIEVTSGLRAAVEEKIGKLERYFNPDTEVIVTPVSYTHLNHPVHCHHRQRTVHQSLSMLQFKFSVLCHTDSSDRSQLQPVSYTHLDVYKRQ